jgi:iron complex outermembrane receptor protein
MSRILTVGFFLISVLPVAGQSLSDSILTLPEVEVFSERIRINPVGNQQHVWTVKDLEASQAHNLSDLLQTTGLSYVRSYGLGSLATTSFRGSSAQQTLLLWNGVPIQNPMLGIDDLALIPVSLVSEIRLTLGGNSAIWGSGAIGGTLALNNPSFFNRRLQIDLGAEAGSFGWKRISAHGSLGSNTLSSALHINLISANNLFSYQKDGGGTGHQSHADQRQGSFSHEVHFVPHKKHRISLHNWWQAADREIPPTTVQTRSEASQFDRSFRSLLQWVHHGYQSIARSRLAYFKEFLHFKDPLSGIDAKSDFTTVIHELENEWDVDSSHRAEIGLQQSFVTASTENYEDRQMQYQLAIFTSWRIDCKRWQLQLSARQALHDGDLTPFVPSLGIEYQLNRTFSWSGQVGRSYRAPTLNDRYWQPGGNENLRSEQGWTMESTIEGRCTSDGSTLEFSITGFNKRIKDWILWTLAPTDNFYSPRNIADVWSRGMESLFSWENVIGRSSFKLFGAYQYVRSTNEQPISIPRISKGSQLIYTPKHQTRAGISYHSAKFRLDYTHQWVGSVYTFQEPLDGFQLGLLKGRYYGQIARQPLEIFGRIENLWNTSYRIIERRPMPGRHFRLGLLFQFSKDKS